MHEFDLRLRASHVIVEHLSSTWTAVAPTIRAQLLADDPSRRPLTRARSAATRRCDATRSRLFNADCYGSRAATVDAADKEALASLDAFLRERSIPVATEHLLLDVPLDGDELCAVLHEFGVPLRRLNAIAVKANALALDRRPIFDQSSSIVQSLCVEEMVVRAAKQCFKVYMQNGQRAEDALNGVEPHVAVADFLNCFLGSQAGQKPKNANDISNQEATLARDPFAVTPHSLWVQIRARLKAHFEYEAPATLLSTLSRVRLLRAFAHRVGIQLRVQAFKFNSPAFVHARDIARIYPRVKFVEFTSALAESVLGQGRHWLGLARNATSHEMLDSVLERAYDNANLALHHANSTGAMSELSIVCQELMLEVAQAREEAARTHLELVRELLLRESAKAAETESRSAETTDKLDALGVKLHEVHDTHQFLLYSLVDVAHQALSSLERTCGALHYRTVRAYRRFALALAQADRFTVAAETMRRALYLLSLVSPHHPELPLWLSNYADILFAAERVTLGLAYGAEAMQRESASSIHQFELLGAHVQRLMRAEQFQQALPLAQRYAQHTAARAKRDPRFQQDADMALQVVSTLVAKAVSARKSAQAPSKVTIESESHEHQPQEHQQPPHKSVGNGGGGAKRHSHQKHKAGRQ
jgi:hypothetical protein